MIACPHCKSIWVCWNWCLAFGGDRETFEKSNPHIPKEELKDWTHECWDCSNCFQTFKKVPFGVPYWVLKLYGQWKWRKEQFNVRKD